MVNSNEEINFNYNKIKYYKVDKSQIKENKKLLQQNKGNLFSFLYNDKLKTLILLLINKYQSNLEEIYLINKNELNAFYLDNINKLINKNNN